MKLSPDQLSTVRERIKKLTPRDIALVKLIEKEGNNADLFLLKEVHAVDEKVDTLDTKVADELKTLEGKVETVQKGAGPKGDRGDRGESIVGPRGERGEKGDPGESIIGQKGEKGDSIVGPIGPAGENGRDGVDGKDGSIKELSPDEIRDSLELLQGDERLNKDSIKGLEDLDARFKEAMKRPTAIGGAKGIGLYVGGVKKLLTAQTLNFKASTGISISYASSSGANDLTFTNTGVTTAAGATGTILRSNGSSWLASTATYPDTVTVNQVLYATGTNAIGSSASLTFDATTLTLAADQSITGASGTAPALTLSKTFTNATNPTTPAALVFTDTITQTSASLAQGYGITVAANFSPSTTGGNDYTITTATGNFTIARFAGSMTSNAVVGISNLQGVSAGVGISGASPTGKITLAQGFIINQPLSSATGTPSVTFANIAGLVVQNQGTAITGVVYQSPQGIAIANQSNGTVSNYNLQLGGTAIPVAGNWSIYNGSAYQNAHSGKSFFGGTTVPTALVHLAAGTATANTAPLQFTSGTLETVARAGVVEFLTDDFYGTITTGAARKKFVLDNGTNLVLGRVPYATTNGRLIDSGNLTFDATTLTLAGDLAVTGSSTNTTAAINATKTYTNSTSPTTPAGLNFIATMNQTSASLGTGYGIVAQGIFGPTTTGGTDYTITNAYGNSTVAFYSGTMTSNAVVGVTNLLAVNANLGMTGVSPIGKITNGTVFNIAGFSKQATGSPSLLIDSHIGLAVQNLGSGAGSGGYTNNYSTGIAIANQSGAAVANYNLHLGTTSINFGGSYSIINESTFQNIHAGKSFFGGTTSPTAQVHLTAGTASANTAPLKFTSGTLLTSAEAGAVEFLTDDYYATITTGAARKGFVLTDGSNLTSGRVPYASTNGRLIDSANLTFTGSTLALTGSETISSNLTVSGSAGFGTSPSAGAAIVINKTISDTESGCQISMVGLMQATTGALTNSFGINSTPIFRALGFKISNANAMYQKSYCGPQMAAATTVGHDAHTSVATRLAVYPTYLFGGSTQGTITDGIAFDIQAINNEANPAAATVDVRYTRNFGVRVQNMGTAAGFAGVTIVSGCGFAIADTTGATNNTNLLLGTVTIPTGTYSIHNASTAQNVHAGKSFFGGTTTPTAQVHLTAGTASANTSPLKFTMAGSVVLTTPETGAMETDTDNVYLTKKTAIRESIPGVIFTQTADKSVTNTVTETSIVGTGVGTLTLPANFWVAGKTIKVTMSGVYSTVAITGDTVTIKLKYGSTVLTSKATSSLLTGATNLFWSAEVLVTCRSTGATGTVQVSGGVIYQVASSATVEDALNNGVATTTLDTTASGLFDVTVTHSAADPSNTVKSLVGAFEILN